MLTEINVGVFKTPPPSQDHLLWEWQLLWRGSLQRGEFHKAVQFIQFPLPGLYHLKTWRNKLFTRVFICVGFISPICGVQNHISTVLHSPEQSPLSMLTPKNPLKQNVVQVATTLEYYAAVNTRPVSPRAGEGDGRSRVMRRRHKQVKGM